MKNPPVDVAVKEKNLAVPGDDLAVPRDDLAAVQAVLPEAALTP